MSMWEELLDFYENGGLLEGSEIFSLPEQITGQLIQYLQAKNKKLELDIKAQKEFNRNFMRISRERKNQDLGWKPKDRRFQLLYMTEYTDYRLSERAVLDYAYKIRLQTSYDVESIPLRTAKSQFEDDYGYLRDIIGGVTKTSLKELNTAFVGGGKNEVTYTPYIWDIKFEADYRTGVWNVSFMSTMPLPHYD